MTPPSTTLLALLPRSLLWPLGSALLLGSSLVFALTLVLLENPSAPPYWMLPLLGLGLALTATMLATRLQAPSITPLTTHVVLALLATLIGALFLAYHLNQSASHPDGDLHALVRYVAVTGIVLITWQARIYTALRSRFDSDSLQRSGIVFILGASTLVALVLLLSEELNQSSPSQITLQGRIIVILLFSAAVSSLILPGIRRWLPQTLVSLGLMWFIAAGHLQPQIMLAATPFIAVIYGLFIPARRWPLTLLLWLASMSIPAYSLGDITDKWIANALSGGLIVVLSVRLNQLLATLRQQHKLEASATEQPSPLSIQHLDIQRKSMQNAILASLIGFVLGWVGIQLYTHTRESHIRNIGLEHAQNLSIRILDHFRRSEKLAQALLTHNLQGIQTQAEFEQQIRPVLQLRDQGMTLQWSPAGVLRFIAPLEGKEDALGLNLRTHPDRREGTESLIRGREARWAGPFPLVEGGLGLVLQIPVYEEQATAADDFIGIGEILHDFPATLSAVNDLSNYEERIELGTHADKLVEVFNTLRKASPNRMGENPLTQALVHSPESITTSGLVMRVSVRSLESVPFVIRHQFELLIPLALLLGWAAAVITTTRLQQRSNAQDTQQRQFLNELLKHTVIGVVVFREDGSWLSHNPRAAQLLHSRDTDIQELNIWRHPLWNQLGWNRIAAEVLHNGKGQSIAFVGESTMGARLDVEIKLSRIFLHDRPHVLTQITDLSAIHENERQLRIELEKNQTFLRNASDGIVILNPDGHIEESSQSFCDQLGYDCDEMSAMHISQWEGRLNKAQIKETLQDLFANREVKRFETQHRHKNGTLIDVEVTAAVFEANGQPLLFITARDIRERLAKSKKLLASERLLRQTQYHAQIGSWTYDRDQRLFHGSDVAQDIFGVSQDTLAMEAWISQLHPEDRDQTIAYFTELLTTKQQSSWTNRIIRANGETRWIQIRANRETNMEGKEEIRGSVQDVTEFKQLEIALRTSEHKAVKANQAKSHFLASMSHEIRTPLNAIIGTAHLLHNETLNPEQQKDLATIEVSSTQLLDLINDVLDLSKIEAGELTLEPCYFNLPRLIQTLENQFATTIRNKPIEFVPPTLDTHIPTNLVGDVHRLRQILINLLGNAFKFTQEGRVSLAITRHNAAHPNQVELEFTVRDSGIGISAEQQVHLFAPFHQADSSTTRKFGGSGLGLSITKQLVERMGGRIDLDSTLGQGASFCVRLPFGIANDSAAEDAVIDAPFSLQGRRLMVVDDSAINLDVMRRLLQRYHADVVTCATAHEAIEVLQTDPEAVDLVLMDMQMPEMDGAEAAQYLRQERGLRIPILALTAGATTTERERAWTAGMDDFLSKPIDPEQLVRILQQHLARADRR